MPQAQHTPGPYRYIQQIRKIYNSEEDPDGQFEELLRGEFLIYGDDDHCIGEVGFDGSQDEVNQDEADARLLAAAPELLDAVTIGAEYLRHLIAEGVIKGQHAEMKLSVLDTAIAKAKGAQP